MRFPKCELGEIVNKGTGLVSNVSKPNRRLHHSSGLGAMSWKVLLLFRQYKISIMNQRLITMNSPQKEQFDNVLAQEHQKSKVGLSEVETQGLVSL